MNKPIIKRTCLIKNYAYFAYMWDRQVETNNRKTTSPSESTKNILSKLWIWSILHRNRNVSPSKLEMAYWRSAFITLWSQEYFPANSGGGPTRAKCSRSSSRWNPASAPGDAPRRSPWHCLFHQRSPGGQSSHLCRSPIHRLRWRESL